MWMVIKLGRMTSFIFKGDYSNDENRERLPEKPGKQKGTIPSDRFFDTGWAWLLEVYRTGYHCMDSKYWL